MKLSNLMGMALAMSAMEPPTKQYLDAAPYPHEYQPHWNPQRGNPKRDMRYDKPTIKAIQKRRLRNRLARKSRQVNR